AMEIIKLFRNYIFKNLIFFQSSNLDLVHIYDKYRDKRICVDVKVLITYYPMNKLFRESYAP
ncbi:MAG: hypothetical protein WAL46_02680, partial [Nitrososphaeraceae archaeon]